MSEPQPYIPPSLSKYAFKRIQQLEVFHQWTYCAVNAGFGTTSEIPLFGQGEVERLAILMR
jgi:hypothetical protein